MLNRLALVQIFTGIFCLAGQVFSLSFICLGVNSNQPIFHLFAVSNSFGILIFFPVIICGFVMGAGSRIACLVSIALYVCISFMDMGYTPTALAMTVLTTFILKTIGDIKAFASIDGYPAFDSKREEQKLDSMSRAELAAYYTEKQKPARTEYDKIAEQASQVYRNKKPE
ncbi:MAG: hypothetical protein QM689_05135 [Oscillospiraceae bacterium]